MDIHLRFNFKKPRHCNQTLEKVKTILAAENGPAACPPDSDSRFFISEEKLLLVTVEKRKQEL
jgi:hypothetical protein